MPPNRPFTFKTLTVYWEARFAITAKSALLALNSRTGMQHPPARFSTVAAYFGHMLTIPTHNFAALSASEPRLA